MSFRPSAMFHHFIKDVLQNLVEKFIIAYLDDILLFSDKLQKHLKHISSFFERLRKIQLYIKLEKCEFEQPWIQFLGHIIFPGRVNMATEKIKVVVDQRVLIHIR